MRAQFPLLAAAVFLLGLAPARALEKNPDLAADEEILHRAGIKEIDGRALLDIFRTRILTPEQDRHLKDLVGQLGDARFRVRKKAYTDLLTARTMAVPYLMTALRNPDIEVARLADRCLRQIDQLDDSSLVAAAARLVAWHKPAEAVPVLLAYCPHAPGDQVAQEVQTALNAVALRDGKPHEALVKALKDTEPRRRAAAGEALIRVSSPERRAALHFLLRDPEALVRLPAALAFLDARDREAVPVIIALLAELPPDRLWQAEEALYRLAGEQAPEPAGEQKTPQVLRTAWAEWWKQHGDRIDLAKIDLPQRLLGYKLVVISGTPRGDEVLEYDRDGKVRWRISRLSTPRDAQVIPGNRVLIAEEGAGQVTERDFNGKTLWVKKVNQPIACERLPGGRTFIATRSQLLMVDRGGKETKIYSPPTNNHTFATAIRFPDGQFGIIQSDYLTFQRFNPLGKPVNTFKVVFFSVIGHIEVLKGRRLLVPEYRKNRVAEYDFEGKVLHQLTVQQPTDAVQLPNGHVLVSSWTRKWMAEMDHTGKVIREQSLDGLPCRVRVR